MNVITPISGNITVDSTAAVRVLHRDFETRSVLDLRKVGAHRYAADQNTETICCAYAVGGDPVQLWIPGNPVPPQFIAAATEPNWIAVAHNDQFETLIERYIMGPQHGWPVIPPERHCCTMTAALAAGLPAKLERVADYLELANRKDAAGARLMHQMSKPRKPRKGEDPEGIYWFDDPERLERLYAYCKQDVEVERELHGLLKPLPEAEHALWLLSNTINNRGFCIDRDFIAAAKAIAAAATPEITAAITAVTGGAVTSINQVARLMVWLKEHGYAAKSLGRRAVEKQLEKEDLSPQLRRTGILDDAAGDFAAEPAFTEIALADAVRKLPEVSEDLSMAATKMVVETVLPSTMSLAGMALAAAGMAARILAWLAITYVLTKDDPFAAIDLDHCRDASTGSIDSWAQKFLARSRGAYVEITPSGDGLRIWGAPSNSGSVVPRRQ